MSERAIIEMQIQKKVTEIQSLEDKLKGAKIYVKALEDVIKALDRGGAALESDSHDTPLRSGSLVAQARDVILAKGVPIHIDVLLSELGKEVTRETKASLAGSIAAYVRKGKVFSRLAPNTFGLVELGHTESVREDNGPPENFGYTPSHTEPDSTSHIDDEIPF